MYGVLKLRNKILGDPDLGWREQYAAHGTEEGRRPWQAGAISVERAGGSPADGRLRSAGNGSSHPTVDAVLAGGESAGMSAATSEESEQAAGEDNRVAEQSRNAAGEVHHGA